ncbi:VOC family protein [Rhodobacteraceae bacterium CCMM004]|nr:VOC family protein [Rhodobacteraceae bacterium CCMM004]
MLELDHLAVAAETLEAGVAHVEAALGVTLPAAIGRHPQMGTHNRLLSLGPGVYLEVIAVDPDADPPGRSRWFDLDAFVGSPRIGNWIARTDDLGAALAHAPFAMGTPTDFSRGDYRWTMAVPEDGRLPFGGAAPALIAWDGTAHPADALPESGCRLTRFEVAHPRGGDIAAAWPALAAIPNVALRAGPPGDRPKFRAEIATPEGPRVLT